MAIVHGVGLSPFVRKVRVAMAEKGLEYELRPVMPGAVPDDYHRISPLRKIPCYQDGDFTLPDSSCIIAYLERIQPAPALYPSNPEQFGRALWFEEYSDSKLSDTLGTIFFQRFVRKNLFKQEPDEELVAQKFAEIPELFDYLEGQLGERDVLVGNHFSIADIAVGSIFVNFAHVGERVDASRWRSLAAYVDRIHARPSFKAVIEEEKAIASD
jgi:glutathione S-transferase